MSNSQHPRDAAQRVATARFVAMETPAASGRAREPAPMRSPPSGVAPSC